MSRPWRQPERLNIHKGRRKSNESSATSTQQCLRKSWQSVKARKSKEKQEKARKSKEKQRNSKEKQRKGRKSKEKQRKSKEKQENAKKNRMNKEWVCRTCGGVKFKSKPNNCVRAGHNVKLVRQINSTLSKQEKNIV